MSAPWLGGDGLSVPAGQEARDDRSAGLIVPASRAPSTDFTLHLPGGAGWEIDFTTTDYLGLMASPQVVEATRLAGEETAANPNGFPLGGRSGAATKQLEEELGRFLQCAHVALYSSARMAFGGAVGGLVRATGHVVLDALVSNSVYEAATARTRQVHTHRHLEVGHLTEVLGAIRARDPRPQILVITEALFATEADGPDLMALQTVCREYNAVLCVIVTHDLGALGSGGTGRLGQQDMLGKVDLIVGSFFPTFAASGCFVATRHRAVYDQLRYHGAGREAANALSPVQLATVLQALAIVRSPEGERRRRALAAAVVALRAGLAAKGGVLLGDSSMLTPMVPLLLGPENLGRMVVRLCAERGVHAQMLEYPEVPMGAARLQLNVRATQEPDRCVDAAGCMAEALAEAEQQIDFASVRAGER